MSCSYGKKGLPGVNATLIDDRFTMSDTMGA